MAKTSKTIDTLIGDIHEVLEGKSPLELATKPDKIAKKFGENMFNLIMRRVLYRKERRKGHDRREMIRFEPSKEDRRSGKDRRKMKSVWDDGHSDF